MLMHPCSHPTITLKSWSRLWEFSFGWLVSWRGFIPRAFGKSSNFILSLIFGKIIFARRINFSISFLRINHWLVLITFLQHTDPLLPHYRAPEFTFPRGALATLDRNLLGDCGKIMSWIGGHATNGISETHILHHVSSKIPHYNASVVQRSFFCHALLTL